MGACDIKLKIWLQNIKVTLINCCFSESPTGMTHEILVIILKSSRIFPGVSSQKPHMPVCAYLSLLIAHSHLPLLRR